MPEITRNAVMTAPTRDTHALWTVNNPIIPEGVLCITKDRLYEGSVEYFVGDGVKTYNELDKFGCTGYGCVTEEAFETTLASYATKAELGSYATKAELTGTYATKAELTGTYATKAELGSYATKAELTGTYATKAELGNYQPAISVLTAEPSASALDEGEIAFVVEA